MEGTPAQSAGFQRGDVIQTIDGEAVTDVADVQSKVGQADLEQSLEVNVMRGGRSRSIQVTPTALPDTLQ